MLKISLIFLCVICSFSNPANSSNPGKKFSEYVEGNDNIKKKKVKISHEIEHTESQNDVIENKRDIKPNFDTEILDFLKIDHAKTFTHLIDSPIKDNIKVARDYAENILLNIEKYLTSITNSGIKYFSYEDFEKTRHLEDQEIKLRRERVNLYGSMYAKAEDLYLLEENDPLAIEIAILFYLEEAYIIERSKRKELLFKALEFYFQLLNKQNEKFNKNKMGSGIGLNAILDRNAYHAAVTMLSFHEKFGSVFKDGKIEVDFDALKSFIKNYKKFIEPLGKDFNPFYGYPSEKKNTDTIY